MAEQASRFTSKETEMMAQMFCCLKDGALTNAMFDIPKFAKMAGVTEGSARNIMTRLRKKIAEEAGGEPVSIEEGKQKKKPAAKRKRPAKGAEVETEAEAKGEGEASE